MDGDEVLSVVASSVVLMFELDGKRIADAAAVSTAQLASTVAALRHLDASVDDAERIDQLRLLEELKAAAAAAQASVTAAFRNSQEEAQRAAGARTADVGKGVAAQVALAKRESPARARRYLGWASILVDELPHTHAALARGETSEWRAMVVARETGWLSREHRSTVDATLAGQLQQLGDRETEARVREIAYRLDPHGYVARSAKAEADRRVSLRPAPDTMSYFTAHLPVGRGVAAYAALAKHADSLRAAGDERSRGQIMADTLVERVTGQATADAVPVEVRLVMTDQALLNIGDRAGEPANVEGHGPIPADLARRLLLAAPDQQAWLRRLYTSPETGQLVALESTRRVFDGGLREFCVVRDRTCRTPWCDAPLRHVDHVVPAEAGGPTSAANGQGLCEACNYAKQTPGWRARPSPNGAAGEVVITTPTQHTYASRPPAPSGRSPTPAVQSRIELFFCDLLDAA